MPDQQRSSSCFPVCFVGSPAAHFSFVCSSHGGGSLRLSQGLSKLLLAGLHSSAGLPILDRPWRMSRGALLTRSFPSKVSSHLRATSHCPQQHQQTGTQMQSDFPPLDQPQGGSRQYQPSGNDLTPPTGANANSDAIVNAQPTHLISRDDEAQGQGAASNQDALMPDAPAVHDIATPRRMIGGRCRKWCISAQPASGKRKCAACCMCGTRFTHSEPRLQQWGVIAKPTITTYTHTVSTEVSVMIMNCTRNWRMIRKQLMQLPANGIPSPGQRQTQKYTSCSLRIRIKPQQPRHLMMSEDLFGSEEALRMDDEIMDFQWFEHITWDSIKDLRGTTYVQPPTTFKLALQQAQHAILRAIIHKNPTSLASESAWKALVLSSWLLLGRPAVNASESNCAHFLDARLELFWAEDWSALLAMVRADCDVAPVQNTTRRTDKQQMQSRVRKVATLARTGEKGRALAAARNAPPVPVTEPIVQEIKRLYPADPEPTSSCACLRVMLIPVRSGRACHHHTSQNATTQ